jgi:hypothetical protein
MVYEKTTVGAVQQVSRHAWQHRFLELAVPVGHSVRRLTADGLTFDCDEGSGCAREVADLESPAGAVLPSVPWFHRRSRPMLANGLQPSAAGDSLPWDAGVDRPLVLASRRSLVPSVGVSRSPRKAYWTAAVRSARVLTNQYRPERQSQRQSVVHLGPVWGAVTRARRFSGRLWV